MDFRAGNPILHTAKSDCHRHALHKLERPLQAPLHASISRHVMEFALG